MNAILIGYRGSGKSSVADVIAACTNRTVYHMDEAIAQRAGCGARQLVAEQGWDRFWALEAEVAQEAARLDNAVIDTGGGVIQRPENMLRLKATGPVFWLTAHVDTIKERIKDEADRPSLTGNRSFLEEVDEVLDARLPLYAHYADHLIETDHRSVSDIANDIVQMLCSS
ncbi:MAG: shikimate kinase [Candidatus Hydrogenedentes bacterium]|nr:shikimate kinase [Candidatus Hydrogenedentota bacterium]